MKVSVPPLNGGVEQLQHQKGLPVKQSFVFTVQELAPAERELCLHTTTLSFEFNLNVKVLSC